MNTAIDPQITPSRENALEIYTLYDHPSDFPDSYVLRRYLITKEGPLVDQRFFMQTPDVEVLRYFMAGMGKEKLSRDPSDDACILESYV